MEWILSGTLGKFAMKLRGVGDRGDPCTLQESALRNLLRIIDWFPIAYVIGIVLVSISDKRQRAGDRIAHTIVTVAPKRDMTPTGTLPVSLVEVCRAIHTILHMERG
jgi:uncharacterized RDD family membrane protein YckC